MRDDEAPTDIVLSEHDSQINAHTALYAASHAQDYEAFGTRAGYFYRLRLSLVLDELNQLRPSSRLLDIGCGAGIYSAPATERGYFYTGIDMSPKMIQTARRVHPGREFHIGSVASLRFDAESFDAVLALGVLEYVASAQLPQAFDEIARVLRPGGTLIASLLNRSAPIWFARTMKEGARSSIATVLGRRPSRSSPEHLFGPREIAAHLDRAGFDQLRVKGFALVGLPDRWYARTPEWLIRGSLRLEQTQRGPAEHVGMARLVVAQRS